MLRHSRNTQHAGLVAVAVVLVVVSFCPAGRDRSISGLRGQYFRDASFETLAFERLCPRVHRPEGMNVPEDWGDFSIRWMGELDVPDDGEYHLSADADDSVRVWLGGTLVLDTRDDAAVRLTGVTLRLQRGRLPLRIDYRNTGGGHHCSLRWKHGRMRKPEPIPAARFRSEPWSGMPVYAMEAVDHDQRGKRVERKPGWRGRYYAGRNFDKLVTQQRDRQIHRLGRYAFPDGRREDLSVRWTGVLEVKKSGKYTFYSASDDGRRLWIDHRMVHESWKGQSMEESKVSLELERGRHPIMLEHYQGGGESGVSLSFAGPGIKKTLLDERFVSTRPWEGMTSARPMVILLALGHSNMEGRAKRTPKGDCPRGYVMNHESQWEPAEEDNGPMWPLLQRLTQAYPGVDFGMVKVARSAASIKQNFLPGKREYEQAVKLARQGDAFGTLTGVVIMQGWLEVQKSKGPKSVADLTEDYRKMVSSLRKDLGREELPVLASQVELGSDAKGKMDAWHSVHDQIAALPERIDHLAVVPSKDLDMVDGHHFSRKGNEEWADRAMKTIAKLKLLDELPERSASKKPLTVVLPAKVQNPDAVLAEADLKLRQQTEGRTVEELGTYRNLLVVNEYEVKRIRKGKLPSKRVLVVEFAVKDGKPSAVRKLKRGDGRRLKLRSWSAQRKLQSLPLDDDILDLDAPLYFAR